MQGLCVIVTAWGLHGCFHIAMRRLCGCVVTVGHMDALSGCIVVVACAGCCCCSHRLWPHRCCCRYVGAVWPPSASLRRGSACVRFVVWGLCGCCHCGHLHEGFE